MAQGQLEAARAAYQQGLDIRVRLAAGDPSNTGLQRDVAISLWRIASLPNSKVRWSQVLEQWQAMKDRGILAPSDERFLTAVRMLAEQEASASSGATGNE